MTPLLIESANVAAIRDEAIFAAPGSTVAAVAWSFGGQTYVTVIAKATFAFAFDADMPRVEPEEWSAPTSTEKKNPARSARVTSDLAPYLPFVDVVLHGARARAGGRRPRARPARAPHGRRRRGHGPRQAAPGPGRGGVRAMPIVYERTYRRPRRGGQPGSAWGARTDGRAERRRSRRSQEARRASARWAARGRRASACSAGRRASTSTPRLPGSRTTSSGVTTRSRRPTSRRSASSGGAVDSCWRGSLTACAAHAHAAARRQRPRVRVRRRGRGRGTLARALPSTPSASTATSSGAHVVLRGSLPVEDEAALGRLRVAAGSRAGACRSPGLPRSKSRPTSPCRTTSSSWPAPTTTAPCSGRCPSWTAGPRRCRPRSVFVDLDASRARRIPFPGSLDTADLEVDQQRHLAIRPAVPFAARAPSGFMRAVRPSPPSVPPPSTGTVVLAPRSPRRRRPCSARPSQSPRRRRRRVAR